MAGRAQPLSAWGRRMQHLQESFTLGGYALLMQALQPLLRRKLQRRGRTEPGYLQQVPERFGHYDTPPAQAGAVWVHAVSLGETRAAALLIDALRQRLPGMRLLLTHSTATGRAQGQALLLPGDAQVWLPWDTPEATRRFLKHHRPCCGLLMETEVWPALVRACQQQAVPLYLVNARLNDKSFQAAKRWPSLSGPAYRGLSGVFAQSDADAQRLQALGAKVLAVLGNLKFDVKPQPEAKALALQWRAGLKAQGSARPVVMLASTREGEENLWLDALAANVDRAQAFKAMGVLWLLVPRHPQRFEEVHQQVQGRGWAVFRRSALPPAPEPWPAAALKADVWLGDSLGEMPVYFQMADMALLGGSFMPLGGQNLIEAAAFGCPIVMGPHTFNFAEASQQAEEAGAAARVRDMDGALNQVLAWLEAPQALAQAQQAGLTLIAQSRGAADRYAQAMLKE